MSIRFRFEWVDAAPSPDTAAQHTMAKLSIEAGGATVTSVLDRRSREYREHVVVPLLPVAEWLAGNWQHIRHEVADTNEQRPGFESRHNLAFAGNGFVLPRLSIIPSTGQRVNLQWKRWKPQHARIEFIDEAETHVDRTQLEPELRTLIESVLERLRALGDGGAAAETLANTWRAIESLDADEEEFCRAAALLGIDPFDVADSTAGAIAEFWENTAPSIREEALASAGEDSLPRVSEWLDDALATLAETANETDWADIRSTMPPHSAAPPWERGYSLANAVRERVEIGEGPFYFESRKLPAIPHRETEPPCRRIQGLVAANAPACVTAPKNELGKRFLLARALGDYMGRSQPGAGILSSLITDRQAQSRAFAAEFLAPAESLRARLDGAFLDEEKIDDLGYEFGVSSQVIGYQIENHGLAAR